MTIFIRAGKWAVFAVVGTVFLIVAGVLYEDHERAAAMAQARRGA